ncbi:fungal-specific transcription factor domain-containing protein [Aspergillus ambiguus]|uniref:transcription factor domain-containing protein n=1 Tax=Aspergillus ambiguus TaxID=176160 RepID=UPI003CCD5315
MSQQVTSLSGRTPQFTFVSGNIQSEARSHAMREHWKHRHKRNELAKSNHGRRISRTLLPRSSNSEGPSSTKSRQSLAGVDDEKEKDADNVRTGIPAQLLCGIGYALSTSRPDPFQTCPIFLTSQHQRLLHHWIGTHAAMMFEELDVTEFNPMRDVWFPLDLSNASTFNCVMAHSAAHLAHLYAGSPPRRGTNSSDALKYKIEAVRILRLWLADPEKELSDDAFAATVRLLTFERYWGTVADWQIHRDGLQRMIDAKGGVRSLHENWRLELVVYLVSLMSRPSWLESTNNLDQISRPVPFSSVLQPSFFFDVQKVRCLWLISFIQDMRTFMRSLYFTESFSYPAIHSAVDFLRHQYIHSSRDPRVMGLEDEMLWCLFAISVLVQESASQLSDENGLPPALDTLAKLEIFLRDSQHMWMDSVHNLRSILHETLILLFEEGAFKFGYITDLVQVLDTLSVEARQGVIKCLINLLHRLGNKHHGLLVDDGWTPDSLLSSMHGH